MYPIFEYVLYLSFIISIIFFIHFRRKNTNKFEKHLVENESIRHLNQVKQAEAAIERGISKCQLDISKSKQKINNKYPYTEIEYTRMNDKLIKEIAILEEYFNVIKNEKMAQIRSQYPGIDEVIATKKKALALALEEKANKKNKEKSSYRSDDSDSNRSSRNDSSHNYDSYSGGSGSSYDGGGGSFSGGGSEGGW